MRVSNRTSILDAAVRLIESGGVTAVTLDSVATEAGLTKGGLMYHFPTREALLAGIHGHLAAQWEGELEALAGGPASSVTPDQRLAAYVHVSSQAATRGELILFLEAGSTDASKPWKAVLNRWTTPIDHGLSSGSIDSVIARLAADGLWMYEALGIPVIDTEARETIAERIATMVKNPRVGELGTTAKTR